VTQGWLQRDVLLPLGIAGVGGLAALGVRWLRRRDPAAVRVPGILVVPTLSALAFCFAAAPRARYGAASFCILAAQATVLALQGPSLAPRHKALRLRREGSLGAGFWIDPSVVVPPPAS
jgi:hypothetical protein